LHASLDMKQLLAVLDLGLVTTPPVVSGWLAPGLGRR
jgi:hypothetical protein